MFGSFFIPTSVPTQNLFILRSGYLFFGIRSGKESINLQHTVAVCKSVAHTFTLTRII